ncbi:MAG: hypothetical protein Q8916_03750 [Bacteroidota bacterium]|nr:hypothetical protein [Bacteroidota bacterium]MDP4236910.1 hypothetical protein [Bacteroidota bacterium]
MENKNDSEHTRSRTASDTTHTKNSDDRAKPKRKWKTSDTFGLIGILIAAGSLLVSYRANLTANSAKALMGQEYTFFGENPEKWTFYEDKTIDMIGVERIIRFQKPFKQKPRVSIGITNAGFRPVELVMKDLHIPLTYDDSVARKYAFPSVAVYQDDPQVDHYTLSVGMQIPHYAIKAFIDSMRTRPLDERVVESLVNSKNLRRLNPGEKYNPDEIWTTNWHTLVGTVDVNWTAEITDN